MRSKLAIALCAVLVAAVALPLCFGKSEAQSSSLANFKGIGFKVQIENYPPPHERQIKTSLEGEQAEPQPGGFVLLTEARLKSFTTNGVLEMQAHAPKCTFDTMQRTVSSTGLLHVQMANDRFSTVGQGFLLQTNGNLILSNQVHTVIRNLSGKTSKQ